MRPSHYFGRFFFFQGRELLSTINMQDQPAYYYYYYYYFIDFIKDNWVCGVDKEERGKNNNKSWNQFISLELVALLVDLSARLSGASLTSGLGESIQRCEGGALQHIAGGISAQLTEQVTRVWCVTCSAHLCVNELRNFKNNFVSRGTLTGAFVVCFADDALHADFVLSLVRVDVSLKCQQTTDV